MCFWSMDAPPEAKNSKSCQISQSYIFTTAQPPGDVMSEKCKQPLYELTVQKHSTTYKGGMELHTDGQSNYQMHPAVDLSG